jgi:anti-sigma factor RsiW
MSRMPDTHAEAWALLPWLANGRIAPEEREWVDAHVAECAECRAELAAQRMIAQSMTSTPAGADVTPGNDEQMAFNKLWARIEAAEAATLSTKLVATGMDTPAAPRTSRTIRWLAAAVVVQAIGLGVLAVSALRAPAGSELITVSMPQNPLTAPAVRLVFAPEASMETINTLLAHQGLQLVEGPGLQGNFTAVLSTDAVASGASADTVAAVMKKDPNVSFAEPVAR